MKNKRGRITGSILALLAATVVACGSIQGAAGLADPARGGGTNYLTDGEGYGTGFLTQPGVTRMSGGSPVSGDTSGAMLQP